MVFHTLELNILTNKHHYEVDNLKETVQSVTSINYPITESFLISERTLHSRHSRLVILLYGKMKKLEMAMEKQIENFGNLFESA